MRQRDPQPGQRSLASRHVAPAFERLEVSSVDGDTDRVGRNEPQMPATVEPIPAGFAQAFACPFGDFVSHDDVDYSSPGGTPECWETFAGEIRGRSNTQPKPMPGDGDSEVCVGRFRFGWQPKLGQGYGEVLDRRFVKFC